MKTLWKCTDPQPTQDVDEFISSFVKDLHHNNACDWAGDVMIHFSKSVPVNKQTHLQLEWVEGEYIFMFGWTLPWSNIKDYFAKLGNRNPPFFKHEPALSFPLQRLNLV